jgi:hypothetical protein
MALVSMPALSQCLGVRWIIIDIAIETLVDVVVEILQSFFPCQKEVEGTEPGKTQPSSGL